MGQGYISSLTPYPYLSQIFFKCTKGIYNVVGLASKQSKLNSYNVSTDPTKNLTVFKMFNILSLNAPIKISI